MKKIVTTSRFKKEVNKSKKLIIKNKPKESIIEQDVFEEDFDDIIPEIMEKPRQIHQHTPKMAKRDKKRQKKYNYKRSHDWCPEEDRDFGYPNDFWK